jgi:hypothetical protein
MNNKRILNGQEVKPIMIFDYYSKPKMSKFVGGKIVGGDIVLDENGRPILFRRIGVLENDMTESERHQYKTQQNTKRN